MTTLYEKINTTCEHGHYARVHNPIHGYIIVSPTKDHFGRWRETEMGETLTAAASGLGSDIGNSQAEWAKLEAKGWVYAGVYHPPSPKPYEVGQKVRVSEMVKDHDGFDDWDETQKDMAGKICEIKAACDDCYGLRYEVNTPDKSDWWIFRHEWLEPVFEDEEVGTKEKPQTIIIDGKEYDLIPTNKVIV